MLFGCYLLGLLAFLAYPAVGPCIAYPESLDPAYQTPLTADLMRQMAVEYRAAIAGGAVNGFAYFVALPSLHVAVATLLQLFWAPHRIQFWTFLPVNLLMAASTVVLGYHYLVDVPPAVVLAGVVFVLGERIAPAGRRSPDTA
jgi:membrane-associated phospholipid phosphatase